MLTDIQLQNKLEPVLQKQVALETFMLSMMIQDANSISKLSISEIYKFKSRNDELSEYASKIEQEILNDMDVLIAGFILTEYMEMKNLYDARNIVFPKLANNPNIKRIQTDAVIKAKINYSRALRNAGFAIKTPTGLVTFASVEDTYRTITNRARQAVALKSFPIQRQLYNDAVTAVHYGLRTTYLDEDGKTHNERMLYVLDNQISYGTRDAIKKMTEVVGNQVQSDGIELSAHVLPAPDHAPAQGHQFTLENWDKMQSGQDFEDIQGRHYNGFVRQIGTWNCKHYPVPIVVGETKQRFSDRQLKNILDKNEAGYTDSDGIHYTLYQCSQVQRKYERYIREAKLNLRLSKALGSTLEINAWQSKVANAIAQYEQFSKDCGIPVRPRNITI